MPDQQEYNLAAIRRLLLEAFTPGDLRRFCQDNPRLQEARTYFGQRDSLQDMIDELISFCQTRMRLDELLDAVSEARPRVYSRYADFIGHKPGLPDYLPAPTTDSSHIPESQSPQKTKPPQPSDRPLNRVVQILAVAVGGGVTVAAIVFAVVLLRECSVTQGSHTPSPTEPPAQTTAVPTDTVPTPPSPTLAPSATSSGTPTLPLPTDTPLPTSTQTPPAASADTPTLPPRTDTPMPTSTTAPALPADYEEFDSFDTEGPLRDYLWYRTESSDACSFKQEIGYLWIQCQNYITKKVEWRFSPRVDSFRAVRGVAMAAQVNKPRYVDEDWGQIHLMVQFGRPVPGPPQRTYHISLRGAMAHVVEIYPEEEYRPLTLATIILSESQMHVVQIEFESGQLFFFIDGKPVDLAVQPNLPANPTWYGWQFEGFVDARPEAATVELDAFVDWIAVKK